MSAPDYKIMVTQKAEDKTFYKQVGVAWKGETKDGREKIRLQLWMFPNTDLNCFPNESENETKARFQREVKKPSPNFDDDVPF